MRTALDTDGKMRELATGESSVSCGAITFTVAAAEAAGVLPDQIRARGARALEILNKAGFGNSPEAHMLRKRA
jgi:hypothetical protein